MGCIKSKQTFPFPNTISTVKRPDSEERFPTEKSSMVSVRSEVVKDSSTRLVVLEYAHRLSQEIMDEAVKQWAANDSRYGDIPYIENETVP
ncbi:small membrane A-kinase anchor protein isoform X2 [Sarcophilus harrisii]|uniref:Small membrane A-kinase anchor protein n=1 Tax=Sarcophilus harrisii TaxID=9305 RepID=A0A7N4P728_SARHA|nr:small membrane A-kinase anchor protein isoform X2 [Sarcophilus harrisii]XP_023355097.1 small membrane A-kinase anchor protein isoform X2 [Sarcophilus harrisii]XP_031816168.1 small membrane A-kinase anchor protein isoform X2 [Sarcophilus harrisii]XP_031816169.1 small membrane A-kinase anchor protein isoform X2 [Sarcophilus harrisii]XP_031816171.1 small membrane A-kinase anchor protein isoform X2 [Sarcophilus harrisii]XP_031816172.1 small membrane A-kinase anchor protein isoform X2 [Sarcophil